MSKYASIKWCAWAKISTSCIFHEIYGQKLCNVHVMLSIDYHHGQVNKHLHMNWFMIRNQMWVFFEYLVHFVMFMYQKIVAPSLIQRLENVCLFVMISDGNVGTTWILKYNILSFRVMLFLMRYHHIMSMQNPGVMMSRWSHSLIVAYLNIGDHQLGIKPTTSATSIWKLKAYKRKTTTWVS